jgi:DnaJ-class molecular chaperone
MNLRRYHEARKLLNLDDTATIKEIKDSYRRLANIYHPIKIT